MKLGRWEYNADLVAAVFLIADVGPGDWSLDSALGNDLSGPGWALFQLAATAAGSAAVIKAGQSAAPGATDSAPAADPATAGVPELGLLRPRAPRRPSGRP